MNQPIHNDELNRVLLKPRFKFKFKENKEDVLAQFKVNLEQNKGDFISKIIDHHIVIDVPPEKEHFWSPQLHVEIEDEDEMTIVKGIMGPKPKVWTFFMFLHFAVAVAFFVFFVIFYSRWSLNQDYMVSMIMCLVMPVVWVALYFMGQLGKKFGYDQMVELHDVLTEALKNLKAVSP